MKLQPGITKVNKYVDTSLQSYTSMRTMTPTSHKPDLCTLSRCRAPLWPLEPQEQNTLCVNAAMYYGIFLPWKLFHVDVCWYCGICHSPECLHIIERFIAVGFRSCELNCFCRVCTGRSCSMPHTTGSDHITKMAGSCGPGEETQWRLGCQQLQDPEAEQPLTTPSTTTSLTHTLTHGIRAFAVFLSYFGAFSNQLSTGFPKICKQHGIIGK